MEKSIQPVERLSPHPPKEDTPLVTRLTAPLTPGGSDDVSNTNMFERSTLTPRSPVIGAGSGITAELEMKEDENKTPTHFRKCDLAMTESNYSQSDLETPILKTRNTIISSKKRKASESPLMGLFSTEPTVKDWLTVLDKTTKAIKVFNELVKNKTKKSKCNTNIINVAADLFDLSEQITRGKEHFESMAEKILQDNITELEDESLESFSSVLSPKDSNVHQTIEVQEVALICSKCQKVMDEEEETLKDIAQKILEIKDLEKESDVEKALSLCNSKWPEAAFKNIPLKRGNPALQAEGNICVILCPGENSPLLKGVYQKFPEVKELIDQGIGNGDVELVEYSVTKKDGRKSRTVYLAKATNEREILKGLQEIKRLNQNNSIAIAATEKVEIVRVLMELVFRENGNITYYVPRAYANNQMGKVERETEAITIKAGEKSYSEMLQKIKENVVPGDIGVNVTKVKRINKEDILVVTKRGDMETLKKELTEKISEIQFDERKNKRSIHIIDMEEGVTKEEIVAGIETTTGEKNASIEVNNLRKIRSGNMMAIVTTDKYLAEKLVNMGKIKVGWTWCRLKNRTNVRICINCLKIGHLAHRCPEEKSEIKKCLKCTETGHIARECTNEVRQCLVCNQSGHSCNNTGCPAFRQVVRDNERNRRRVDSVTSRDTMMN